MRFSDYLNNHISKEMVSFHMPGHKGRGIFDIHGMKDALNNLVEGDITEIPGSDNLSQPQGIIRNVMDRYKALYGSKESFISVGGSTLGLMASIMAVVISSCGIQQDNAYAVDKSIGVAIARNSHKSVFSGVKLSGARPVYIYPELPAAGIAGEITRADLEKAVTRAEEEGIKIKAVVIPSPNYYGVCCDAKEIEAFIHEKGAALIVDQAHGAHLRFLEPRLSMDLARLTQDGAEQIADIVIESTHKTLASFTQTAIVNVYNSALVDSVEENIKLLQTTSPSYILMKSLDLNAELIEKYGDDLFESWRMNLDNTYAALDEMGIAYYMDKLHDRSKILLDMSGFGLSGADLSKELFERGIVTELDSGPYAMCMSGIGNSKGDYERLINVLADIKSDASNTKVGEKDNSLSGELFALMNKEREMCSIPRNWEWVQADSAEGRVCAESIIPYPPGIPLIAAGEVMDAESLSWAEAFRSRGERVFGMNESGFVKAGK